MAGYSFDTFPLEYPHDDRITRMKTVLEPMFRAGNEANHPNLDPENMKSFLLSLVLKKKLHPLTATIRKFGSVGGIGQFALKTWGIIMMSTTDDIRSQIAKIEGIRQKNCSLENILLMLNAELEIRNGGYSVSSIRSSQVAGQVANVLTITRESDQAMIDGLLEKYMSIYANLPDRSEISIGDIILSSANLFDLLVESQKIEGGNTYFHAFPVVHISDKNTGLVDSLLIAIGIIDLVLNDSKLTDEQLLQQCSNFVGGTIKIRIRLALLKKLVELRINHKSGKNLVGPSINEPVEPGAGEPVEPGAGEPVEPGAGEPVEPEAGEPVEPEAGEPVEPEAGEPEAGEPEAIHHTTIIEKVSQLEQQVAELQQQVAELTKRLLLGSDNNRSKSNSQPTGRINQVFTEGGNQVSVDFIQVANFGRGFWDQWSVFCKKYALPIPPEGGTESIANHYKRILGLPDAKKETMLKYISNLVGIQLVGIQYE